jgi:hypothetical protein
MATWREAPEVQDLAEELIPKHHKRIQLWADEIRYVFRDEAQRSKGRVVFGKAHVVKDLACYLANHSAGDDHDFENAGPADMFVIEIAWDVWEQLNPAQRLALVDHELEHLVAQFDDSTLELKRKIRGHDIEEFHAIAQRHGAWEPSLVEFQKALQLPLFARDLGGGQ